MLACCRWQLADDSLHLARTTRSERSTSFSAGCRKEQAGSPVLPRELVPRELVLVRHCATSTELVCLLQMFFSQLSHPKILQPAAEHPMVKRIVGSELVSLFFIEIGFVKLA